MIDHWTHRLQPDCQVVSSSTRQYTDRWFGEKRMIPAPIGNQQGWKNVILCSEAALRLYNHDHSGPKSLILQNKSNASKKHLALRWKAGRAVFKCEGIIGQRDSPIRRPFKFTLLLPRPWLGNKYRSYNFRAAVNHSGGRRAWSNTSCLGVFCWSPRT